ncbi:MAG: sensor histidine kinase [Peptococcales bacterium]|jgi:two-component system LytT family sensor kinase
MHVTDKEFTVLQEKVKKLEFLLAQMEIKSLENQIKPHFVFNTLNLVARLIYLNKNQESLEVVYALSKLLRYAMEKKELVRLRDEVQYIKNYLFIQQKRYGEQLKYKLDISQNILSYLIPTMALQPLVDNAIKHGLEPKGGGSITIYGRQEDENIILKVIDDGIGFTKEDSTEKSEGKVSSMGTGIKNIDKRIQFYYGDNYKFNIFSQPQVGTEVTIILPFKCDYDDLYVPVFWFDK